MKIEDIFTKTFKPEFRERKPACAIPLSEVNHKGAKTKPIQFEIEVFTYLNRNMREPDGEEIFKVTANGIEEVSETENVARPRSR